MDRGRRVRRPAQRHGELVGAREAGGGLLGSGPIDHLVDAAGDLRRDSGTHTAYLDDAGIFTLPGLPPATYTLTVSGTGIVKQILEGLEVAEGLKARGDVVALFLVGFLQHRGVAIRAMVIFHGICFLAN